MALGFHRRISCTESQVEELFALFASWDALFSYGLMLTTAVSPGKNTIDSASDISAMNPIFHQIHVMANIFYGNWIHVNQIIIKTNNLYALDCQLLHLQRCLSREKMATLRSRFHVGIYFSKRNVRVCTERDRSWAVHPSNGHLEKAVIAKDENIPKNKVAVKKKATKSA